MADSLNKLSLKLNFTENIPVKSEVIGIAHSYIVLTFIDKHGSL